MKIISLISIFFLMTYSNLIGQTTEVTFKKSPKKYKYHNYIYEDIKGSQQVMNCEILFKKNHIWLNGEAIHKLYFGSSRYFDYISFSKDTIYYYQKKNELNNNIHDLQKKPLFILNENSKEDTLFTTNFGMIYNHFILYYKKYFYSAINDTVYTYKLWYKKNPFLSSSSEDNYFYFDEIALSKKYGFVWINYVYHNAEVKIKYY